MPFHDLNTYFRQRFGQRVHKLSVDAGLTCPNRDGTLSAAGCIFCNARGSGTGVRAAKGLGIAEQIRASQGYLRKRFKANKFIVYFQSYTNTYAPLETLRAMWDEALSVEDVIGLSIGTRPDCISPAVLDQLQDYASRYLIWIEYGLQSANDETLQSINRGHDLAAFVGAVRATRNRGIDVCAHVILGLPGETAAHMAATADILAALNIDGIKLHLLYVVRETRLAEMYRNGTYRCLTRDQYVELACDSLQRLPRQTVIQRLASDPHRAELIAPRWALDKAGTIERIAARLRSLGSFQGANCDPERGRRLMSTMGIDAGKQTIKPVGTFCQIDS